jgi:CheY-like chemotaxis protein
MPEMDGLEASKRIQELYAPEQRPRIIALSADTVQVRRGGAGPRGRTSAGPHARPHAPRRWHKPRSGVLFRCARLAHPPRARMRLCASRPLRCPPPRPARSQTLHERCREAGIEAFLVKPFRVEELARSLMGPAPRLPRPGPGVPVHAHGERPEAVRVLDARV